MEHVEEAGIHSGDSSCVLPAPSLDEDAYAEVCRVVRRLGPALGVVGLLNVQLALVGGEVSVIEVNPRASRTVPFASKATGLNLVDAAVRLAAGARLHELELPEERRPELVSVKAAVLPFARFPGSDPVLGPEMRSTGEVMASAADLPTAFAKAERAAGRPLPTGGTAFLSVRELDKAAIPAVAQALAELGFDLLATAGTAAVLDSGRTRGDDAREGRRGRRRDPRPAAATSSSTRRRARGARRDGALIRQAALVRARAVHHDPVRRPACRRCNRERARGDRALAAGADRA